MVVEAGEWHFNETSVNSGRSFSQQWGATSLCAVPLCSPSLRADALGVPLAAAQVTGGHEEEEQVTGHQQEDRPVEIDQHLQTTCNGRRATCD